jgi:hypothetical protein
MDPRPRLAAWRHEVEQLGAALVEIDADHTVALLTSASLTGDTAAAWKSVQVALAGAWDTYRAARELEQATAKARPDAAAAALDGAIIPTIGGPLPAAEAVRSVVKAVATATSFVASIWVAWDVWAVRARTARDSIAKVSPTASGVASAEALLDLLLHDPFAVNEADLTGIEAAARAASERAASHERAVDRFRLDLEQARAMCADLLVRLPRTIEVVQRATERISGFSATVLPSTDLSQLEQWLDRITGAAANDEAAAAKALADWRAAARARADEIGAAEQAAAAALTRRDALRGRWQAYRSKAGDLAVDEHPGISAQLAGLRERLWTAPCDLAAAERELVALARRLDDRPRRPEEMTP